MELFETQASDIETQSLTPFDATEANYTQNNQHFAYLHLDIAAMLILNAYPYPKFL